jgi:D-xylose transport system substrate-binding protein
MNLKKTTMKNNYQNLIIAVVIVIATFYGCSFGMTKDLKIGFLLHSTSNVRWQTDIKYLEEKVQQIGATLIIKDALGDENVQLKQANELLKLGVDILIVVPANQNTAGGIVRAAHDKGVKVISYDRLIKNSDLDYLVSFEYERVGELMVEYVADRVPKGNCVVLWGDANDANAQFIKTGQERALSKINEKGQLKILYKTFIEGWDKTTAMVQMNEIMDFSNEKIDAVISSNITMSLGSYQALKDHGYAPGEVKITGMDGNADFINSLNEGGMTMTVLKPIKELANGAIDLAVDVAKNMNQTKFTTKVNNGRVDVPAKLFSPFVIDKTNYEKELIEKGYVKREEILN